MPTTAADILLHPVRLRIVLETSGADLTARELAQRLPDVSQATLYRHLAALTDAGVLHVVSERRVRGGVERTYRLDADRASLGPEDAAGLTPDEHLGAFVAFVGALVASFDRYVHHPDAVPSDDPVGYRHLALWLTDEETDDLVRDLREVLAGYSGRKPAPGRRLVRLSTTLIPDPPTD